MKKILPFLLALLLCASANAETAVIAPFAAETGEAQIAEAVAKAIGLPCLLTEDSAAAANRMLADPDILLCDTQNAMISSLQGYTAQDLRQEMTPLLRVARCPLFLVMDAATAADCGIHDAASFLEYITENEYMFLLARHISADAVDRAATKLSDELPVLADYYLPEEILEELHADSFQCAVLDGATLRQADDGSLLILCALGKERAAAYPDIPCAEEAGLPVCQDIFIGLYAAGNGGREAQEKASAFRSSPEMEALLLSLGYELSPLSGADFEQEVRSTFDDFKAYMTAEGLFFYEE